MTAAPSSSAPVAGDGTREPADRVRAVVVSWQGAHLLRPCLDALRAQTLRGEDLKIVVVDNGSTDRTAELLSNEYPDVTCVRSPVNLGFAGGVRLGMADFTGGYVAVVNNDLTLEPDALLRLRAALERPGASRVAAATARILLAGTYRPALPHERLLRGTLAAGDRAFRTTESDDPSGLTLVNSTGNIVRSDGTGVDRDWLEVDGAPEAPEDVFGFCGGASLLRRVAVEAVGGFDANLFLYYEDTDLSWRLRAHGWQIRYVPAARAEHLHAASSDVSSALFRFYNTRNSLIVFTRHAPLQVATRSLARQAGGYLRAVVRDGNSEVTRARGRALAAFLRLLPRTLIERRRLWRGSPVSRRAVAKYLVR